MALKKAYNSAIMLEGPSNIFLLDKLGTYSRFLLLVTFLLMLAGIRNGKGLTSKKKKVNC